MGMISIKDHNNVGRQQTDLKAYEMATRHGWNITQEMRDRMVCELNEIILTGSQRDKVKASALLAQINRQNIDIAIHQDTVQSTQPTTVAVVFDSLPSNKVGSVPDHVITQDVVPTKDEA